MTILNPNMHINLDDDHGARNWAQRLGVSMDELVAAVQQVGTSSEDVQLHLEAQRRIGVGFSLMLLNIDKAHRTAKLHALNCDSVALAIGTPFRPLDRLGRDGGWFHVESAEDARAVILREYPRARLSTCKRCSP